MNKNQQRIVDYLEHIHYSNSAYSSIFARFCEKDAENAVTRN